MKNKINKINEKVILPHDVCRGRRVEVGNTSKRD